MLIKGMFYLVNLMISGFDRAVGSIMDFMDSLYRTYGQRVTREWFFIVLKTGDRLLLVGKQYLKQVRTRLKYRLYFEAVTKPMSAYYKELNRR